MRKEIHRPDCEAILRRLKDFQRDTVTHVFQRMYLDPNPAHRYLVADEVGLGKTLVARGLIARAIDHLWEKVERLDVIYICSNSDIARQNVNKLNVSGEQRFELASRITLLPTLVQDLRRQRLNFVSFTPGTSFDLKSNLGTVEERALIYHLLHTAWGFGGGAAPYNVLQGYASVDRFRDAVWRMRHEKTIDKDLAARFAQAVEARCRRSREDAGGDMRADFDQLCELYRRSDANVPKEGALLRTRFVGDVRALLSATCLQALEPDLIILDEFQRFKSLLDGEDDAGKLARELLHYSDEKSAARVLLLSATPYKMYTVTDADADDNHYKDFERTLRFLQGDAAATSRTAALLEEYRRELRNLADGTAERLRDIKTRLERELRRVMVRTERLAASEDRNGMLVEATSTAGALTVRDAMTYRALQKVADAVEHHDTVEYWKSAPWLLSFMDDYKLKEDFEGLLDDPEEGVELRELLRESPELLIPRGAFTRAPRLDPPNSRMRWLLDDTVERGMWKLLWIPPSNPYQQLAGPFAEPLLAGVTKRLVFSSWQVVPKAIATVLSYEAERRMLASWEPGLRSLAGARKADALLRFARADGRLTGMPVLALLYPGVALAWAGDPLKLAGRPGENGALPSLDQTLAVVARRIRAMLERVFSLVKRRESKSAPDERWYWAAPVLLDLQLAASDTRHWLSRPELAERWSGIEEESGEDESLWAQHVDELARFVEDPSELGTPPDDLADVLALLALAGPATCALRSFARVAGEDLAIVNADVRDAAGRLAWAFRNLFNLPEVTALVRGFNREEPYWRRVLEYCASGGLQAVLDEYAHVLHEAKGLLDASHADIAREVAAAMRVALSLRTTVLGVDEINPDAPPGESVRSQRMRGRFALRFGQKEVDEGEQRTRAEQVRESFNSPFWPFVLASTSVGQEGLDFHLYCHAVVHWNLPANPVDLEQREGRVHRYKGHAVRRNVVLRHRVAAMTAEHGDPWRRLFDAAAADRQPGSTDVVPYWVYSVPSGARIERHVPALPLSRDFERLGQLRRSLAVYRIVFGQPRQDELLDFLLSRMPREQIVARLDELRIDLAPAGRIDP
jgi:hypothetical protein